MHFAGFCYLIGNIFNKGIAFLTIPIFTRLMTTAEYGIVNSFMSLSTVLVCIVGLSLGQSIRSASIDFKDELDSYISSIYTLSFVDFLLTAVIVCICLNLYSFKGLGLYMILGCVWYSYMRFIVSVYDIKYMMKMEYVKRTVLLVFPNLCIAVLAVLCLIQLQNNRYIGEIGAYIAVYSILGIGYLVFSMTKGRVFYNKVYWKYALRYSLPLLAHSISIVLLANSDQLMITAFKGTSETGIYGLIYSISLIPQAFFISIENVWIPWFTKKMEAGDKAAVQSAVKPYIYTALIVTGSIIMFSPEILCVMAPQEYWHGKALIPIIMMASFMTCLYSISVDTEYYYRKTKVIALNTIVAAGINFILNLLLIPTYGGYGAACATLISYMLLLILHIFYVKKLDSSLFSIRIYILPLIGAGLCVLFFYIWIDLLILRWGIGMIMLCIGAYKGIMKIK